MLRQAVKMARYARLFATRDLVHVNLQLLYSCPFRCNICDFWKPAYRDHPRLSLEQVGIISGKLAQVGPQIVSIGGGEPLMHKDIIPIVRALARDHFPVMICNGWLMTPELAHGLFDAGIHEVSISLDYADPAIHDAQRGVNGAYERAVAALRMLSEARVHPRQRVHMISVILDDNLDHVEPLIRLCRDIGVTYLVTLYSHGRGTRSARCVPIDVSDRLLDLMRRYPEFVTLRDYVGRFSRAVRDGGVGGCKAGRCLWNIDCQGNVSFCIDRVGESHGNILTDDVRVLRARMREAARTNTCRDCWTSCRGAIESLMDGEHRLGGLWDYHQMTRAVPLAG